MASIFQAGAAAKRNPRGGAMTVSGTRPRVPSMEEMRASEVFAQPNQTKDIISDIGQGVQGAWDDLTGKTAADQLAKAQEYEQRMEAEKLASMRQASGDYERYRPDLVQSRHQALSNMMSAYQGPANALATMYGGGSGQQLFAPPPPGYAPVTRPPGSGGGPNYMPVPNVPRQVFTGALNDAKQPPGQPYNVPYRPPSQMMAGTSVPQLAGQNFPTQSVGGAPPPMPPAQPPPASTVFQPTTVQGTRPPMPAGGIIPPRAQPLAPGAAAGASSVFASGAARGPATMQQRRPV